MPGPPGSLGAAAASRTERWAQIYRVTRAILDGGEVRERQHRSNWPVSILLLCCTPASHCGNEKTLFLKCYFQLGQLLFIFSLYPLWGQKIVAIRITTEVYESLDLSCFYPLPGCLWIVQIHLDGPHPEASLWSSPTGFSFIWPDRWNQSICLQRPCFLSPKMYFFIFPSRLHFIP